MDGNDGPTASARAAFWCGSYTPNHGAGAGIGILGVDAAGTVVAHSPLVRADSPSWVATHPRLPLLYAVGEFSRTVRAYRRTERGLVAVGGPKVAGDAVCHVEVDPDGRYLVASCWGDGQVILYDLDEEGTIRSRRVAPAAEDPHAGTADDPHADHDDTGSALGDGAQDPPASQARQSRAHEALVLPDGRILTIDLGFDLVRVWRHDSGAGLVPDHEVVLPRGSGPRHGARHPSGHLYVLTELSSQICVLSPDSDGRYRLTGVVEVGMGPTAEGDKGAEISVSADGRFVHATIRGSDRLCTLAVGEGGASITPVGEAHCGGANPRHHREHGGLLYVAAQDSNEVVTFRLDAETGLPGEPVGRARVGSPSCIAPL